MDLKNILFGVFIIIVGVDIFFGKPFISKGLVLDKNIGILFWIWGVLFVIFGVKSKEKTKSNKRKNKIKTAGNDLK